MFSRSVFVVAVVAALGPASAQDRKQVAESAVILQHDGMQVTRAEFERLAAGMKGATMNATLADPNVPTPGLSEALILAHEARRRGIDKEALIAAQVEMRTNQFLAYQLFQSIWGEVKKDEAGSRKYFASHPPMYDTRDLSRILVRFQGSALPAKKGQKELSEAEAKSRIEQIRTKILGGADFAATARQESDDQKTAASGGSMGRVARGQITSALELPAFRLKEGEVSEPIKTEDGWQLIRVDRIHGPEFEVVRKAIEYEIAQQKLKAIIQSAQFNEEYFGKR